MRIHTPLMLSVGFALLPALAKEVPIEPGRRESERNVKQGVDAELQKQVDQAIDRAKDFLLGRRSVEDKAAKTAEGLRRRARELKERFKLCTNGKEKRNAELKSKALLRCAAAIEAGREPEEADAKEMEHPEEMAPEAVPAARYGPGEDALVGLALVQAGVPPSDPVVQRIWKGQADGYPFFGMYTYMAAVQLMLADAMMHAPCGEAWPPPESKDEVLAWIRKRAEGLASGCNGGAWTYGCPEGGKGYPVDQVAVKDGKSYSLAKASTIGSKTLTKTAVPKGDHDFSNSQYAVLGLKAAALCGVRPKNAEGMWRLVVQQFLTAQETQGPEVTLKILPERPRAGSLESYAKGWVDIGYGERQHPARARGWGYTRNSSATHTMTAAGLTALLVGRSELSLEPEEAERVDAAVRDGLAWMQSNWNGNGLSGTGGAIGGGNLGGSLIAYLVYGLERMGVLGELRTVGGHDWYAEGARRLVGTQGKNGAWNSGYGEGIDTAFCLLFLCRGTRKDYAISSYEVTDAESPKPKASYKVTDAEPAKP